MKVTTHQTIVKIIAGIMYAGIIVLFLVLAGLLLKFAITFLKFGYNLI